MTAALEAQERSYTNLNLGREKGSTKPKINNPYLPLLLLSLHHGATIPELATESGLSRRAVKRFVDSLRQRGIRIVYICGYESPEKGGTHLPIYILGTKQDVPAPPKLTTTQRSAKYRAKQKHLQLIQATAGTPQSP